MQDLQIGTMLGDCKLTAVLGRGGMGVVYLAEQRRPERQVAVKVMAPQFAADPQFRSRFEREWNLAAAIRHPNIVPIWGVGELDGLLYVVMHFVDGRDLGRLLAEEPSIAPLRVVGLLAQVADALDAAHQRRLVHRDVKPQNILVASGASGERADFVYLADFGLTKRLDANSQFSESGQFVGTVQYAAPEQVLGLQTIDGRADVYALGCVVFEALVGQTPFRKETDYATLHAHVNEPPPLPSEHRPTLPQALNEVIAVALAKDPAQRFATATELVEATRQALRPAPVSAEATVVVDDLDVRSPPDRGHIETERIGQVDASGESERSTAGRPLPVPRVLLAGGATLLAVIIGVALLLVVLRPGSGEQAQQELLAHVPAALADECQATEPEATAAGVASVSCAASQGISVEYTVYPDTAAMEAAYVAAREAQAVLPNSGPCAVNDRGEASFRDGGRHFCYRDEQRDPWIVWSSPNVNIVSAATTSGERGELFSFVQERAGPQP